MRNGAGNLKPLVETIRQFAPDCSILVIDDNSPDGTGRIADEIRGNLANVHVLHRRIKQTGTRNGDFGCGPVRHRA